MIDGLQRRILGRVSKQQGRLSVYLMQGWPHFDSTIVFHLRVKALLRLHITQVGFLCEQASEHKPQLVSANPPDMSDSSAESTPTSATVRLATGRCSTTPP